MSSNLISLKIKESKGITEFLIVIHLIVITEL